MQQILIRVLSELITKIECPLFLTYLNHLIELMKSGLNVHFLGYMMGMEAQDVLTFSVIIYINL